MFQRFLNFVKYNNAFTIIFVICLFSFGVSFASSTVREGVYSSEETIISVDNSLIISADLDSYNFNLRITSVTEDEKNYYAVYSYQTFAIEDSVWQNKEIEKTLTVSKEALAGKDFGLHLAKELGENINYELAYLKRVQKLEREKGESQKIMTVEYSGLIGKLLDPKELVIEGYNPVVPEVVPEEVVPEELGPEEVIVSTPREKTASEETSSPEPTTSSSPETSSTPTATPSSTPTPTPTSTSEPETPPSNPDELIDENLVKEVVEELLATPTPTPTPEPSESPKSVDPEPVVEEETPAVSESVAPAPVTESAPESSQ